VRVKLEGGKLTFDFSGPPPAQLPEPKLPAMAE
jgi:hypothetical protein